MGKVIRESRVESKTMLLTSFESPSNSVVNTLAITAVGIAASTMATWRVTPSNPNKKAYKNPIAAPPTKRVAETPNIIPHRPWSETRET